MRWVQVARLAVLTAIGGWGVCASGLAAPGVGGVEATPSAVGVRSEGWVQPSPQVSPAAVVQPILRQWDPAPHLAAGCTPYYLGGAQIDGAGNVLFAAILSGGDATVDNDLIVYYATAEDTEVVLREGQQAPGMPAGVIVCSLLQAHEVLAENGLIAIMPKVSGPGIVADQNDLVVYVGYPGSLTRVVQSGEQAIGCEPGVCIVSNPSYVDCYLSDNGTLRVEAKLTGAGVTYLNDFAVWVGPPDELMLAYRDGMAAPGCAAGVTFGGATGFAHNDGGVIDFGASLRGTGVTSANDTGHWAGTPGALCLLAREGSQVPGMPGGVTWRVPVTCDSETNVWGDVVQEGYIQGPGVTAGRDAVLYLSDEEGLLLAAREGDPVPQLGAQVTVGEAGMALVSDCRQVLYVSKFVGPTITSANQWGMYFGPYDAAELVMHDSGRAWTFPRGISLWRVSAVPVLAALNDVGDVAAPTQIRGGPVTSADNVVLWMRHHVLKRWTPLLRSGSEVDGRILYAEDEGAFGCNPSGGADGRLQQLNDSATLAMRLDFTDGTHGIFRICFPFGDGDQSGRVDLADLDLMHDYWTGVDGDLKSESAVFDLDADGDIDLADQALFQQLYQGG